MAHPQNHLLASVVAWLDADTTVKAAVLYGSGARLPEPSPATELSDIDLHVITTDPNRFERYEWDHVLPQQRLCLKVHKPATGGSRKITLLFESGELELVLLSNAKLKIGQLLMKCGLHKKLPFVNAGLNELATSMRTGYRFLKGEKKWGSFYAQVVTGMPGVRLNDEDLCHLADLFLCDLLQALRHLERGEFSASQFLLHRQLSETNFRLLRELRSRRALVLPSFGLARHVERLLSPEELAWVQIDARPDSEGLRRAAWAALDGLKGLMAELVPGWSAPPGVYCLLEPYGIRIQKSVAL